MDYKAAKHAAKIETLVRRANKLVAKGTAANLKTLFNISENMDRALYHENNDHRNDTALIHAIVEVDVLIRQIKG